MNNTFKTFMLSSALVLATSCSTNEEIVKRDKLAKAKADSTKKAQEAAKLKAQTP